MTLSLASALEAQTNTGDVHGIVIDEGGVPIQGSLVTLMGPAAPRTTTADAKGLFRFLTVAPGQYSLTVTRPGFTTVTRQDVLVSVGRNTQIDVQLRLATVEEDVTVKGEAPLIDARKVATGQTFSREQLTEIPTSRDEWSLIQQVPGVLLDTLNVAGNASARVGGPGLTNRGSGNVAYEIDGATVTDNTYGNPLARQNGATNTYFDFSTFQDVEVVTGGSGLDQQNSGVTINVVTKRGTNQLKGSARYLYASANWQSNNTPQEARDQGLQTNSTRYIREYGADLGGPILKDRLWLWAAGSRQDISLNPTAFSADDVAYPQTTTLEPWSAKLNAQISNSNSAALYYLRSDRLEYGTGASPERPVPTRVDFFIPTDFYKAEDSNVFSPDLFASVFASYQNPRYTQTPIGGLDKDLQYYDFSFHNTYSYEQDKDPQKQANFQVSKFFNTGRINHELKASFNYRQQIADSATGLPGDQNEGVAYSSSSASAVLTRGIRRIYTTQFWTGALGDTLTAGNLTIAAGVRYDLQQARNLPSTSFANPLFADPCTNCGADGGSFPGLPEVKYHGATNWQLQFANWQPRVSATYALGERKATLLRASYARFVDQLGWLAYHLSGVPTSNGYKYYWTDLNHDHDVQPDEVLFNQPLGYYGAIDPASLPSPPNQVQPGLRTPTTDEVTAGIDHQLNGDLAVSVTLAYRNTSNLLSQVPIGASLSTYELGGRATGSATSNGFTINFDEPYYDLVLSGPPSGFTFENRPGATQRYYGVDVSVIKRLSRNWMVRGNFGWNSFRQYLTPQSIQNPNNLWVLGGQNDNGGLAIGWSDQFNLFLNAGWQFNLNGLYQGPWGLSFGANFFGRGGYPNPYFVTVVTHDVADNTPGTLIGKVDSYRYANVYELDFRLQKTFQIGPVAVITVAELFNVTNANTVFNSFPTVGRYNSANGKFVQDPSFNQILDVQSPRILRLSLQVNF